MRENAINLRFETSMLLISRGHVLANSKPAVNRQPGFRRVDSYRLVQVLNAIKTCFKTSFEASLAYLG